MPNYLNDRIPVSGCHHDSYYFLSDDQKKELRLPADMDKVIDQVIKNVHTGENNSKAQDRAIIAEQYAELREAVREGYGKLSFQVQYGGTNFAMLKNLQINVGVFSAFKKHDMMKELVKDLKDENGKQRSFHEFRKVALDKVDDYRETWLQTEYNTAVRSSRMAAQWDSYQRSKRLYPNLKYLLSRSANKREDHRALVGTILPIDHPWWDIHYPPNGWECKCGVSQTDEPPTELPEAVRIDPMFAFNPGKEGQVFDVKAHPYGQMPQKEYKEAATAAFGAACAFERKDLLNRFDRQKKVHVNNIPAPVEFNRKTVEKNTKYDPYFFERVNILSNIEEVLSDCTLILTENRKPKQHVKQYYILQHLTSEGKRVNLHIEERKDGVCYLYYIHFQK